MDACSPSQPIAIAAAAGRRLCWAFAFSLVFHLLLIVSLRAGLPPQAPGGAQALQARIAPLDTSQPPVKERAQDDIAPVPQSAQSAADALVTTEAPPAASPAATPKPPEPAAETLDPVHRSDAGLVAASREPTYYAITALDRPPVPLSSPNSCYPEGASEEVEYELLIYENGIVDRAVVLAVHPLGLVTAAAEELCAAVRFAPAVKDGRAVKSRVRLVLGRR
jgi:protein TonB